MSEIIGHLLAAGQRAEVFEWGFRVVKLYRSTAAKRVIFGEAAIHAAVEALGLPVPTVWSVQQIGDRWGIVLDRVRGVSFAERMRGDAAAIPQYLQILARLHTKPRPIFARLRSERRAPATMQTRSRILPDFATSHITSRGGRTLLVVGLVWWSSRAECRQQQVTPQPIPGPSRRRVCYGDGLAGGGADSNSRSRSCERVSGYCRRRCRNDNQGEGSGRPIDAANAPGTCIMTPARTSANNGVPLASWRPRKSNPTLE
jgi:hypothetical protein